MKIQSLSIAVPAPCPNRCRFCVSYMHKGEYENQIETNTRFFDLYEEDYISRMAYCRDNGVNSVILTGDGEPLMNRDFLKFFANSNRSLVKPFRQIELQTSGAILDDEYLRFLRNTVRVSTICLSLSALSSDHNRTVTLPKNDMFFVDIPHLCSEIKRYDFNLRLCLNLTCYFNNVDVTEIFDTAKELGANQLTFRKLYEDGSDSKEARWIREGGRCSDCTADRIFSYIAENGRPLNRLPFGAIRCSVDNMSCVIDTDCMSEEVTEDLKYLILRPDCKLYSHWNDKGSLVF